MSLDELRALRRRLTYVWEDPDQTLTAESRYELSLARGQVRDAIVRAEAEAAAFEAMIRVRPDTADARVTS